MKVRSVSARFALEVLIVLSTRLLRSDNIDMLSLDHVMERLMCFQIYLTSNYLLNLARSTA